jgi:hypothetical protein
MKDEKEIKKDNEEENEIFENELDEEALNVIKRLYDKTFKELVDR